MRPPEHDGTEGSQRPDYAGFDGIHEGTCPNCGRAVYVPDRAGALFRCGGLKRVQVGDKVEWAPTDRGCGCMMQVEAGGDGLALGLVEQPPRPGR